MGKIFKLRNKSTKEVLSEDHYLYINVCIDIYGNLFILHEDENNDGHLVSWIDEDINDEYEAVFE